MGMAYSMHGSDKYLLEKPEGMTQLGRYRRRWEVIRMTIR
jgi:hypothetical protein